MCYADALERSGYVADAIDDAVCDLRPCKRWEPTRFLGKHKFIDRRVGG